MITTPKLGLKKYELTDTWALQDQNENLDKIDAAAVTPAELALKANLASPAFTGTPTAPTVGAGTNTTQIATTAYVRSNRIVGSETVTNASWVASGNVIYPFKKNVPITGVVGADYPTLIAFTLATLQVATDANISFVETYAGGVILYAESVPSASVTFDYVITKG